ncbi:MAG: hypothetical protein M1828_004882 [Chrysothrix sp. TS-e1954]|nr:MAG: hypothetical protein M1828_004882 [Chrysothrix sp. TS-e1954]
MGFRQAVADSEQAPKDGVEIQEGTGMVTSDSLAAESMKADGSFAAGQNASYSNQPSRSTTTNTTDTSGATTLDSARDADDRLTYSDLKGDYKTPGDETRSGMSGTGDSTYDTSRAEPRGGYGGEAPSATGGSYGLTEGQSKPGGKNIQEGGFDSDAPNSSFMSDIGTKNDPSRDAEKGLNASNARAPADSGYPGASTMQGTRDQGGFENLGSEEQA